MDIFKTLTPEAMASAITSQMEQLLTSGSDDVVRLRKDESLAGIQYDMEHKADGGEEEEVTLQVNVPAGRPLYQDSLAAFDKVLELNPDYYGVACQKGVVYGNMHDLENAERCYLKALEDDDEDFTAAYYLSQVYGEMGKTDLAEKYQRISDELNGSVE